MKKYIFITVLLTLVLFACNDVISDTDNSSTIGNDKLSLKYFMYLNSEKAKGSVLIQSNTTQVMQSTMKNIDVSEKTIASYGSKTKSDYKIEFKDLNLKTLAKNEKSKESLFGKKHYYTVKNLTKAQKKSSNSVNEVYIPELLNISFSTNELMDGTTVEWNVDPLNENGVAILLEYTAVNQLNSKVALDNPKSIRRSFVLEDIRGNYIIKGSDLEIFPKGSALSINVVRAGFNSDENNISVAGYTNVNRDMELLR
tara:strand:+ start:4898 stop:5662 length:765 start_codon:yes stop_codon:yes gene_type:complete